MKFNCGYCKQYWKLMSDPYWNILRHKGEEATKDVVLFCPACRIPKVRKDKWNKRYKDDKSNT